MKHLFAVLVILFGFFNSALASNTPLKDAIVKGDLSVAQQYLSRSNMNEPLDKNGLTPLHLASLYGHKAIVKKLLSLGAKVNSKDVFSTMPLHQAAGNGHVPVLRLLLLHGLQLRLRVVRERLLLRLALAGERDVDAADALVQAGTGGRLSDFI